MKVFVLLVLCCLLSISLAINSAIQGPSLNVDATVLEVETESKTVSDRKGSLNYEFEHDSELSFLKVNGTKLTSAQRLHLLALLEERIKNLNNDRRSKKKTFKAFIISKTFKHYFL